MADLTPEDLARLRVPLAELPGLATFGLQLYPTVQELAAYDDGKGGGMAMFDRGRPQLTRGVIWLGADSSDHIVLWNSLRGPTATVEDGPVDVSLTDAATRDRCARWLAGRVGLVVGCTAPIWAPDLDGAGWWLMRWHTHAERSFVRDQAAVGRLNAAQHVPALAALDPSDPRTLPDGSRWVDAVALALVCRAQEVKP